MTLIVCLTMISFAEPADKGSAKNFISIFNDVNTFVEWFAVWINNSVFLDAT